MSEPARTGSLSWEDCGIAVVVRPPNNVFGVRGGTGTEDLITKLLLGVIAKGRKEGAGYIGYMEECSARLSRKRQS